MKYSQEQIFNLPVTEDDVSFATLIQLHSFAVWQYTAVTNQYYPFNNVHLKWLRCLGDVKES